MERLSKLSIAVRAALPNKARSNAIACARGGKWRASQVMIDYLASDRDKIPFHRFIQLCGGYELLPHQIALLDMIEKDTTRAMLPVRGSGSRFMRVDLCLE